MASLEAGEISPRFDKLLKDVVGDLSPEELKYAVSSIKTNFEKGQFEDKGDQDLYSCLHLFANQGLVSEDNLTLLEKFVVCLLYTSPSPRDGLLSRMPSSA